MTESLRVSGVVRAPLETVFDAFLDSEGHSAMTGGPATIQPVLGTPFSAWGGYIVGSNLFLERPTRIVQSWRASDFPEGANDSMLEILLARHANGTEITFVHTGLPLGMSRGFLEGWTKFYLDPMRVHFSAPAVKAKPSSKTAAPKKATPKAKKAAPKKAVAKPKKAAPKKAAPKAKKAAPKKAVAKPKKAAPKKAVAKAKKPASKAKKPASKAKKAAPKKAAPKSKSKSKRG